VAEISLHTVRLMGGGTRQQPCIDDRARPCGRVEPPAPANCPTRQLYRRAIC